MNVKLTCTFCREQQEQSCEMVRRTCHHPDSGDSAACTSPSAGLMLGSLPPPPLRTLGTLPYWLTENISGNVVSLRPQNRSLLSVLIREFYFNTSFVGFIISLSPASWYRFPLQGYSSFSRCMCLCTMEHDS